MTVELRTVGTLSKALAVKREQRDDREEVVVCTLGVSDALIDRDQLDELLTLPVGWSTGALFDEGGAPLAPMRMEPFRGEWEATGVINGGDKPRAGSIKLSGAEVGSLVLTLTKLGATANFKLTWDAHGDEVEDLTDLLGRECNLILVLTDGGQQDLLRSAA